MDEAVEKLRASGALAKSKFEIGNIILSGHSGGYHVMAAILDHGGLSGKNQARSGCSTRFTVARKILSRGRKSENGRLLDIYTDHGGTKEETEKLMASL